MVISLPGSRRRRIADGPCATAAVAPNPIAAVAINRVVFISSPRLVRWVFQYAPRIRFRRRRYCRTKPQFSGGCFSTSWGNRGHRGWGFPYKLGVSRETRFLLQGISKALTNHLVARSYSLCE